MNMNRIITMVVRIVMRRAINSGLNFGINAASGRGRKRPGTTGTALDDSTPASKSPQSGQMARRQRQAAKATRSITKF